MYVCNNNNWLCKVLWCRNDVVYIEENIYKYGHISVRNWERTLDGWYNMLICPLFLCLKNNKERKWTHSLFLLFVFIYIWSISWVIGIYWHGYCLLAAYICFGFISALLTVLINQLSGKPYFTCMDMCIVCIIE